MARLSDGRNHVLNLGFLDADDDRGVACLQKTALRMKARHAVLLVGQRVDERTGVLWMDDRDHELHPGGTIPSRLPGTRLRRSSEQRVHLAADVARNLRLVAVGLDDHEATRVGGGKAEVGVPDADVEIGRIGLEPVPFGLGAPARPRQTDLDRHVEEEGAVRHEGPDRESGHLADGLQWDALAVALVHDARIEEAIGDHDLPGIERRADHLAYELRARAAEQEHLRFRAEWDLARVQKDVTDSLAGRGPSGFTREHHIAAALGQGLREATCLKRLPGSLAPLKGQEEPAFHRYICTRRTGSWPVERDDRLARSASSCCRRRTYAFCGASSISSLCPPATASIASRASSSAWSSGPRRRSMTLARALAIWLDELLRAM